MHDEEGSNFNFPELELKFELHCFRTQLVAFFLKEKFKKIIKTTKKKYEQYNSNVY